jgi:hypothetical protein
MIVAGILGFAQGFLAIAILFALIDPLVEKAIGPIQRAPKAVTVVGRICAFIVLAALYFGLGMLWLITVLPRQDDPAGLIFKAWLGAAFAGFILWTVLQRFAKR